MILPDWQLRDLVKSGELSIDPFDDDAIGPTSIDLRLGPTLVTYRCEVIELGRSDPETEEFEIDADAGFRLAPGAFVLARTLERIRMPNGYQGFLETKGDIARAGIQVHNGDGHVDPGSDHTITLEVTNLNSRPVVIRPGIRFCQIFVHRLSAPCERPYHGKYFGQIKPTAYLREGHP
ncbi:MULTISPECIES: dCTP deaminase [Actinoplanes]|uniref:dCTP deaminase n=1 Tax=Actinoplanes TaxID=1865 RepID=UPI0005F28ACB|nr:MULTISPECIES: dCTP deaminase [Actinoplanes]GLY02794.1 dCTP deaminase [Actinoplanes sp. NBRC 101535]